MSVEPLLSGAEIFGIGTAGIDEAGRGPLAGPVVAAAVILGENFKHILEVLDHGTPVPLYLQLNDSKKLTQPKRNKLASIIKRYAANYSIIAVGHKRIDAINIREATRLAMSLAVRRVSAHQVIIDGNMEIDTHLPQTTIVGGDGKYLEIAAASILAKTYRDQLMQCLATKYCGYGLERHYGYPTKQHRLAIRDLGPARIHRRTFNLLG